MNKVLIAKMTVIFLVIVGVVFWGLSFFSTEGKKSKATGETMTYSFAPASTTATANQEFHTLVKVKSTTLTAMMARGYELKVAFDKTKLELKKIEYKFGAASQGVGQTDANLTAINNQGIVKLVGEVTAAAGLPITNGDSIELVDLTFKFIGTGATTVTINKDTAIVYWYKTDGTLVDLPGASTINFDVNGGSGPTVTGTAADNVKLKLKLKFQGVSSKPPTDVLSKMLVKFRLYDENTEVFADNDGSVFTADENGIWTGEADFNININHKFALLVKGPYHIQKKICNEVPTETDGGTYRCARGIMALTSGNNNLNLSGIITLVGDLPDQNGTVDSYDISLVRNCIGKTDGTCLSNADVNRDGKVDTQDYSLIIASLSVKNDEL